MNRSVIIALLLDMLFADPFTTAIVILSCVNALKFASVHEIECAVYIFFFFSVHEVIWMAL